MNVNFNSLNYLIYSVSHNIRILTEKQKRVAAIALAVLAFLGTCYLLIRYGCFKGEKIKGDLKFEGKDTIELKGFPNFQLNCYVNAVAVFPLSFKTCV